MPIDQRINKENMIHLQNGVLLFSGKKIGIFICARKYVKLEKIIPCDVNLTQNIDDGLYPIIGENTSSKGKLGNLCPTTSEKLS